MKLFPLCFRALLMVLIASGVMPAGADVVKPALVEISIYAQGHSRTEIRASIEALLTGINGRYKRTQDAPNAEEYDELRVLPPEQLREHWERFAPEFLERIRIEYDGKRQPQRLASVEIPPAGYTKVPRISLIVLEGVVPDAARSMTWYYPLAFGDNAVRVRQVNEARKQWHWSEHQWIRKDVASEPFSLQEIFAKRPWWQTAWSYLVVGFDHIVPAGMDHVLFILGIFLLSTRLRPLFWQVTMFTLAHTITLGLSAAEIIQISPRITEPLIALSIAYIGFENLWATRANAGNTLSKTRLPLVFGFGLLHGLGFAGMLADFGMPEDAFFTALISFNVGVELAQITLILGAYLLLGLWFRQRPWYRDLVIVPGSLLIGITGAVWMFERL
ncbi:MAG: HupE/UreJ family protein [Gammaproteobacteria bacterium]